MPALLHGDACFTGETRGQVHGIGPFQPTDVSPAETPAAAGKWAGCR